MWSRLSFSSQFLIAASGVLIAFMAVLGSWVTEQVKASVLETSGVQGAAFMTGFLEPYVQNLAPNGMLDAETQGRLDALFIGTPLGETLVSIKIWRNVGTTATVIYSTTEDLIGDSFISTDVARAALGEVVAEYEDLTSQESAYEQTLDVHLIEVYGPLYKRGTDEVVAVGEIYENADALAAEIWGSRVRTWAVVCITTLLMLAVLYFIVRRSDLTVIAQRAKLRQHVYEAERLADQNERLRVAADKARLDASEANEQLLDRIGSDLHDGPIQMLTLLILKLSDKRGGQANTHDFTPLLQIANDSIAELRNISNGLSLPEIGSMSLAEALQSAISRHEDMSGEHIETSFGNLTGSISDAVKICAYRVFQEGLTNAFKHAHQSRKSVHASIQGEELALDVVDTGGDATVPVVGIGRQKLGLAAMRNRVGALKGELEIDRSESGGTHIRVKLPI